jgi:hypothetical protein
MHGRVIDLGGDRLGGLGRVIQACPVAANPGQGWSCDRWAPYLLLGGVSMFWSNRMVLTWWAHGSDRKVDRTPAVVFETQGFGCSKGEQFSKLS